MTSIKITTDRLQVGLHIRLPVKWNAHPFIMNSFKINRREQIAIIKLLGIQHVYLNPDRSDREPLPVLKNLEPNDKVGGDIRYEVQQLQQEKQNQIEKLNYYRRRVINCEKEFERVLSRMRTVRNKIDHHPIEAVDEANQLIDDIVDKLLCDDAVCLHLVNGKNEFEDIVFFHSLNVTVLSLMIGKVKGYPINTLKELAFASMFHDLGKMRIPHKIIRKSTYLTEPEKSYLMMHTKYGSEIAQHIHSFPESACRVIEQHHELMDGSGYPQGLTGNDIDELAQIVAVANAFDNLCHTSNLKEQKLPYLALSHLFKSCKHLYNNENLNILVKLMGVFPPSTYVQLSNGMTGIVISVNTAHLLYPNIVMFDPTIPRTQAPIINLSKGNIKIANVISPHKLPNNVREYLDPRSKMSYSLDCKE